MAIWSSFKVQVESGISKAKTHFCTEKNAESQCITVEPVVSCMFNEGVTTLISRFLPNLGQWSHAFESFEESNLAILIIAMDMVTRSSKVQWINPGLTGFSQGVGPVVLMFS